MHLQLLDIALSVVSYSSCEGCGKSTGQNFKLHLPLI